MLQNIPKDKILDIVRQGPTFPVKISKQMGGGVDTMLIGAILSTLISTGEVRVSTLKIGGSPLYYVPDQESKLEGYEDHLNDKDKKTFKLLKENKVLQDDLQNPLTRVSLRSLKDFAKPFELTISGNKILFWRYFLLPYDDAEPMAKKIFKQQTPQNEVEQTEATTGLEKRAPISTQAENTLANADKAHMEVQEVLQQESNSGIVQAASPKSDLDLEPHHRIEHHRVESHTVKHHEHQEKHPIHQQTHHKSEKAKPGIDFLEVIKQHLAVIGLDILSKEKIKKTEYDLILKDHDKNEYIYCKAKDKNAVSEGDLAPALIFAQSKKMPCIFLSTGDLTKKAEQMLSNELKGVKFEKISKKVELEGKLVEQ